MNIFQLKIMAANKVFFEGACAKIIVSAPDGDLEILANHQATVFAVVPGTMRFSEDGENWTEVVTGSGFVMVSDNEALFIADTVERPEEIDEIRAREAKERAEEQLRQERSRREYLHSKASLARAMARLKATSKHF